MQVLFTAGAHGARPFGSRFRAKQAVTRDTAACEFRHIPDTRCVFRMEM